jgi:hypothetical protein
MIKRNKSSLVAILVVSLAFAVVGNPLTAQAATSPDLGTASTYSILAGSEVTNTGATTISGDVGISPGIGAAPHYSGFGTVTLGGTIHDADGDALTAQGDRDVAFGALGAQGCDTDYGAVTHELAGDILVPGVYCADSFHLSSGTLTLNGSSSGVWIFKSASDLIVTGSSSQIIFTGGGLACNVWWRVVSSATFDAGSDFVGNVLADTSITMAAGATLDGRALASTAEVTLDNNVISGPNCTPIPGGGGGGGGGGTSGSIVQPRTITVIKNVINDNGGTRTISDFALFVNNTQVISGISNTFAAGAYTVAEVGDPNYIRTFSGDCDAASQFNLAAGDTLTCFITNNDIAAAAVAPTVVAAPGLPNTGTPPGKTLPWNTLIMLASVLMLSSAAIILNLKKRPV